MRKVIFGGANSRDNYNARPDGAVDWILWNDEAMELKERLLGEVRHDRHRPQDLRCSEGTAGSRGERSGGDGSLEAKNPYGDIKTFVFSRTMPHARILGAAVIV